LNVVSVNSDALDATISRNCQAHLNLVHISSRGANARIARDIRRSRQAHLRSILWLEIDQRTSGLALQSCRAFRPVCPLNPSGVLVGPILDIERNASVQRVDEDVARIKPLQSKRNLEVVGASMDQPLNILFPINQVVVELLALADFPNLNRSSRSLFKGNFLFPFKGAATCRW